MIALIALLVVAPPSPRLEFDASLAAALHAERGAFTVLVRQKAAGKESLARFRVAYRRPKVLLMEATAILPAPRRQTLFLDGGRAVVFDHESNEYVKRDVQASGTLPDRAQIAVGPLDEAVRVIVDPASVRAFFTGLRSATGWKRSGAAGVGAWATGNSKGRVSLAFDAKHRLASFTATSTGGSVSWSYEYRPAPMRLAYTPPASANLVPAFTQRIEPPKYADARTRRIANESIQAMDRLRRAEFETESEGQIAHVWLSGDRMREHRTASDWGFDGKTLWIYDSGKQAAYRGKAYAARIGACLNALSLPVDPFVMQIAQKRNPMRQAMIPRSDVRFMGTVKLDGVSCDILEVSVTGLRISLFIRRTDHLPADVTSESLDASGAKLSGTERRIRYLSVGKPMPMTAFASPIPATLKPARLPRTR